MKLFRTSEVHRIDAYTIEHEPIADIDLMERAAGSLFEWVTAHFDRRTKVMVFTGPGNNGGDSLALARMLAGAGYQVEDWFLRFTDKISPSCRTNLERLQQQGRVPVHFVEVVDALPGIDEDVLVVDGIFGSGLSRPLRGLPEAVVARINASGARVVAIDVPTGLFGEDNRDNDPQKILRARWTLTFQFPKLAFFFPENEAYVGEWVVLDIGLHPDIIAATPTPYHYTTCEDVSALLRRRSRFSHKGTFGHALLISGMYGRMGAAVLAARGALRSGAGLLTVHIPRLGNDILQTAVPEAMISHDESDILFGGVPDLALFSAVGAGPALGTRNNTQKALHELLRTAQVPLVLDADALNILALHKEWYAELPPGTILTPHPREFERLAGPSDTGYERVHRAMDFAREHRVVVVLKGAYTAVAAPTGDVHFNMTGNPGMATGGSGDVLTGIILGLLAQRYDPLDAARIGVYLHGLAGDLARKEQGEEALIAGDIVEHLGKAFLEVRPL